MTVENIFSLLLIIVAYFVLGFACAFIVTLVFEGRIYEIWRNTNGEKYKKLVTILNLTDRAGMEAFDFHQPLWYKLLQIFVGVIWPVFAILTFIGFGIYFVVHILLYYWPTQLYKLSIKPFWYWLIGKEIQKEKQP